MAEILNEITPLSEKDFFYIVDRRKEKFDFPAHKHSEYELNFVEGGAGAVRVVGDSVETIGDFELVLIGGGLEHYWEQGKCKSVGMREITIQFAPEIFAEALGTKSQFQSIAKMISRAKHGLSFSLSAMMHVYSILDNLAAVQDPFEQFLQFLHVLNVLSKDPDSRELSSVSFVSEDAQPESDKMMKIKGFIHDHYAENIRLPQLAEMVGMAPPSLSRYFSKAAGRPLMDYIIDVRLGAAARLLVDTQYNISEICERSGFNNLSNFNRIFKAKRGLTPREFRELYKHNKAIV